MPGLTLVEQFNSADLSKQLNPATPYLAPNLRQRTVLITKLIPVFISLVSFRGFAETKGQVSSLAAGKQVPHEVVYLQLGTNVRTQPLQIQHIE